MPLIEGIRYFLSYPQEMLGVVCKDRIKGIMMKVTMFLSSVMVVVDKIFYVVMGANKLYIL